MWQEINMEQHTRIKISPNRLMSFPLVLTPYLDVISHLHLPTYPRQCPFTTHSPDHESVPSKQDGSCCTSPPSCLNLEGQSLSCAPPINAVLKQPPSQGSLCYIWGRAKREWAPLLLSRASLSIPRPLSLSSSLGITEHLEGREWALSQTCSHWHHSKTHLNSMGWKWAQRMKIQR